MEKSTPPSTKDSFWHYINPVWLSVLNSNERAINFYKKTGFEKIGNHDFQIGKENFDFIAMTRDLQNAAAYNCEK
jgi:ribosomal protein S18 acetylase RimI-like enzyme